MLEAFYRGTGRRKTAIAQVRIMKGTGKITVNDTEFDTYFFDFKGKKRAVEPLEAANSTMKYDVIVKLTGGGFAAQADALRLGIARALLKSDPGLEGMLRDAGYLTRDSREKERKKYGHKRARKSFQFSKR